MRIYFTTSFVRHATNIPNRTEFAKQLKELFGGDVVTEVLDKEGAITRHTWLVFDLRFKVAATVAVAPKR